MSLKTFIIEQDLHAEHADRFLLFQERYHQEVLLDLKKTLEKEWGKITNTLLRQHQLHQEALELALLQNPKAVVQLIVEPKSEKITTSRSRAVLEVSPSVKVPLIYQPEERDLIIKALLTTATSVMEHVAEKWREIFQVERKGRAVPWFKLTHDGDEVRFQLSLSDGKQEMYKTLYSVRVEFGKPGSKTRDFDRVYFMSLL